MEVISQIINYFLSIDSSVWALLLGAAGVSTLTEVIKKLSKLESDKVITGVFVAVSALASGLDYILASTNLPPTMLGVNTALLIGVATPLYRYVIKPLSIIISDFNTYKEQIKNKANEIEAINQVASIPAPVLTETTKTDDGTQLQANVVTPVVVDAPDSIIGQPEQNKNKVADF